MQEREHTSLTHMTGVLKMVPFLSPPFGQTSERDVVLEIISISATLSFHVSAID